MATIVEAAPEPVVLIIADISGYTRYMTANAKSLAHSQTLITELVKTILHQIELPLKVAKLEGDAVFLFARKRDTWIQNRNAIGAKLIRLFEAFSSKVAELSSSTTCTCTACTHVQKLRLKVVVHSGEALFHKVFEFEELAGVDVIIAHRLLKNSINADQYLLLTEAAQKDLELPSEIKLDKGKESYDGIGNIGIGVYYPGGELADPSHAEPVSFSERFGKSWKLFLKLWFKPLTPKPRGEEANFHHIDATAGSSGRIGFAALTVLLTPIYLPVGALFVLGRALHTRGREPQHTQGKHVHTADGSCCKRPTPDPG